MLEIIQTYAPEAVSAVAVISVIAPFLRGRKLSDINLLEAFNKVKEQATWNNLKQVDIMGSIDRVSRTVNQIETDVEAKIEEINTTILEFTESEFVAKMTLGLEELDALHQTLLNKDDTIQALQTTIKNIDLQLQKLNNKG